jgi:hypothetical protein
VELYALLKENIKIVLNHLVSCEIQPSRVPNKNIFEKNWTDGIAHTIMYQSMKAVLIKGKSNVPNRSYVNRNVENGINERL